LVGVRLDATNIQQWNVVSAVKEYARIALNDAVNMFPPQVEMVHTSGVMQGDVVVLPKRIDEVVRVEVCGTSSTPRREVKHWHVYPTPATTFLRVYGDADGRLDITYRYRQPPLPADVALDAVASAGYVTVSGDAPAYTWPAPPTFIELSFTTGGNDLREVVMYTSLTPTGFTGLVRSIEGLYGDWPAGTVASACWVAPDEDLRPVMLMAQAVMYEFFLRHRALYDQYTAIASMQAMTLEELQVLIRDLEARARLDYESRRRLPQPMGRNLRRPIPT
jgi:hypothetical protein